MIATAVAIANPFPGLRAFEPEEDYLFFGRERQVDDLLTNLRRTRFLSVVGSSGSGKSSLVRAGLIPALYGGGMVGTGSHWRVAMFRPGEDPMGRMARSLKKCGLIENAELNDSGNAMLEATLRRSSLGLVEAYDLANMNRPDNLLVMVDQFEELFRYRSSGQTGYQDDAIAFVKLLLAAAQSEFPIYVALTMRSDFIGNCADYPELPAAVSAGQYLVPRMTRLELRDAITGPIAVAGAEITPRLVVRLLNDAGEDPEQLPVLQHALMRTWEFWKRDHKSGEPIDFRHYEAIGTMANALSVHAEEAFAELTSDRERQIAEKAFKALTETDEQGRTVRRPTTFNGICGVGNFEPPEVKEVLERFREPGRAFLSPPTIVPLDPSSVIDLSHESLMRIWKRLQTWVTEEQQAAEIYLRLWESTRRHARGQQSFWRNPELGVGLQWLTVNSPTAEWANRYKPGFAEAIDFLKQSEKAEKKRKFVQAVTIAALILLALAAIGIYALLQRVENRQLRLANTQLHQTVSDLQDQIKVLKTPKRQPGSAPLAASAPPPRLDPKPVETKPQETQPVETKPLPAAEPPVVAKVEPPPQQPPPAPTPAPEPDFATQVITAHNADRAKVGVPPLVWSAALAERAQKWADTLAATGELKLDSGIEGQNIASHPRSAQRNVAYVVREWAAQAKNFDYEKNACADGATCANYTLIVWRATKYVGCGTAHDAQRDIFVCDYDPPGNKIGSRPY